MSFAEARSRITDAVFLRFGEDAIWSGVADPVRIHRVRDNSTLLLPDANPVVADERFGPQQGFIQVRPVQVPEPQDGDIVTPSVGEPLTVVSFPVKDRKGLWVCEVLAFDRVVTVLKHGLVRDGYGDLASGFTDVGDAPAAIRPVTGGDVDVEGQRRGYSRLIVRLLRKGATAALTSADRLQVGGKPYSIQSIAELGRGAAIEVMAEGAD